MNAVYINIFVKTFLLHQELLIDGGAINNNNNNKQLAFYCMSNLSGKCKRHSF